MAAARQGSGGEATMPARRVSARDVLAALLIVAWGVLGFIRIGQDVAEYRLQQAETAALREHAAPIERAAADLRPAPGAVAPAAAPYDPALGHWLIAEASGYVLTLALVVGWRLRAGRRREAVAAQVKWVAPSRPAEVSAPRRGRGVPGSRSGVAAAGRLSVVVWNDRFDRVERERA